MRWDNIDEQVCSLARSLSIVGDRWTLLILRNIFLDVQRFSALQKSLGITKHRLSDRLQRLVESGILKKEPYDEKHNYYQYVLTEKGDDLYNVIFSFVQWGDKWLADDDGVPMEHVHTHCGKVTQPILACNECGETINHRDLKVKMGPGIKAKLKRGEGIGFPLNV